MSKADAVWAALGDPTRRKILDLLRDRPRTSGDLSARFPTSRFAIRKHLNVLEQAGLVLVRWQGRERWNHLNTAPLQLAYERWVTPYQALWAGKLTSLKSSLESPAAETTCVAGLKTKPALRTPLTRLTSGDHPMIDQAIQATVQRVELEIRIEASAAKVWHALVHDTTFWWPHSFYTGPAKGFHIQPMLGGKVYEDWGDGSGALWYQVFAINPEVSLDLHGCLAVPYGPAHSLLHLELATDGDATVLKISDSTIGVITSDDTVKIDGWRQVFDGGLKAYVERARRT